MVESDQERLLPKSGTIPSRALKNDSVRKKFRLYEMILAFLHGYMPSTEQFVGHLNYLLRSGVLEPRNRRLSSPGRAAVRNLRAWVEALAALSLDKNGDDKIQDFMYELAQKNPSVSDYVSVSSSAERPKDVGQDVQKGLNQLQALATLLYSSVEFRKIISDALVLAQDIFADAAQTASKTLSKVAQQGDQIVDSIRPSQKKLDNIDKPAEKQANDKKEDLPSKEDVKSKTDELKKNVTKQKDHAVSEGKSKVKQTQTELENYLWQKFPKQRQDALVNRLRKLAEEVQRDPEFKESTDFLLSLLRKYIKYARDSVKDTSVSVKPDRPEDHLERAFKKFRALLVAFAGGKDFNKIEDAMEILISDVEEDEQLSSYFNDISEFIDLLVDKEGYVASEAADQEAHDLYERGKRLSEDNEQYRNDFQKVLDEAKAWLDAVAKDRANRRFVLTGKKVWEDFVMKKHRSSVFRDFADVVLPKAISLVRYIPVPRIEYQDANLDLVVENLVLESHNFLPEHVKISAINELEYKNTYTFTSEYKNQTIIKIKGLSVFIRDASFAIRKKTGWIPFEDRGFADVYMDQGGISIDIVLESNSCDDEDYTFFTVQSVKVNISRFKYHIRQANHSLAASLLEPFVRYMIRQNLARCLENYVRESFETMDKEIRDFGIRLRAATIASDGQASPEAWIRALFSDGRRLIPRKKGQYSVNVGIEEVVLPGMRGPSSISQDIRQVTERVTRNGKGWRNDAFTVEA